MSLLFLGSAIELRFRASKKSVFFFILPLLLATAANKDQFLKLWKNKERYFKLFGKIRHLVCDLLRLLLLLLCIIKMFYDYENQRLKNITQS